MLGKTLSVRVSERTFENLKNQANEIGVNVSILARTILEKGAKKEWQLDIKETN